MIKIYIEKPKEYIDKEEIVKQINKIKPEYLNKLIDTYINIFKKV